MLDARFSFSFFSMRFDIAMKISLTLDSILSRFSDWIIEQFAGMFSGQGVGGGLNGDASHDLKVDGCWSDDAAAGLGADFRAADLG